jgi:hypothetical protein
MTSFTVISSPVMPIASVGHALEHLPHWLQSCRFIRIRLLEKVIAWVGQIFAHSPHEVHFFFL